LIRHHRSLGEQFTALRATNRIGLLPFVPAGYPDLKTTAATLLEMEQAGAAAVEIGFPFSDPIADGPIIQQAFSHALARGIRVEDILRAVHELRPRLSIPLVAMVSFSIIFRYGVDGFMKRAAEAGFDGLIVPDLPPPEAQAVSSITQSAGLDTVMLVAPTTPPQRRVEVASLCSGFIYYLSVSGTTGERDELPHDLVGQINQIRSISPCPVCVGFGIGRPEHVARLRGVADGVIVGSALVRRMMQHEGDGQARIAREAGLLCRELLSQV
jgi:tryptophan synthase alpha chain